MEATRQKMSGLNLNPLAPAQSKHSFVLSGKTRNSIENASIPAPFFCPFLYLFRAFSRKHAKGSRVPPQSRKKTPKWIPKVPKRSPRIPKWSPKVRPNNKKNENCTPRVSKCSSRCYNGVLRSPKMQKTTLKGPLKCY